MIYRVGGGGGSHEKLLYRGNRLERRAWTVCRFKGLTHQKKKSWKKCRFEQPFAIFGIYPGYFKKLGEIKMDAFTIETGS